jgi:EAL domain-containing protein (putative c-di-GMP-specific phosphodiesterase class I)
VALFQGQEVGLDALFKQADLALYQAKNAGRNAILFYNPDMQAAINARTVMEAALRESLKQNELQLFYQPQVDENGKYTGAEALLRWIPANGKAVSPAQFIPLAEDTGLILPIGEWVLATACTQIKRWEATPETRALTLAINVSARQFHQANFVEQAWDHIKQSGIDPKRLKLELTESVVLDHVDEVVRRMQQLKALGVGFSLDDFGTGFSSLSYLKKLPLDQVKIDQSFVRDITHDANDAAIVRAILAMCQSLGLQVIAEGVETEEQRDFLYQYGCKNFQGYLFGKPTQIESWPMT